MRVKAPSEEEFEVSISAIDEANEVGFNNRHAVAEENTKTAPRDVPSMEVEDYLFFKSAYETNPVARAAMDAAGITFPDVEFEKKMRIKNCVKRNTDNRHAK